MLSSGRPPEGRHRRGINSARPRRKRVLGHHVMFLPVLRRTKCLSASEPIPLRHPDVSKVPFHRSQFNLRRSTHTLFVFLSLGGSTCRHFHAETVYLVSRATLRWSVQAEELVCNQTETKAVPKQAGHHRAVKFLSTFFFSSSRIFFLSTSCWLVFTTNLLRCTCWSDSL